VLDLSLPTFKTTDNYLKRVNHTCSILFFSRNVLVFIKFQMLSFLFLYYFRLVKFNVLVLVFVKGIIIIFVSVFVNYTIRSSQHKIKNKTH